MTLFDLPLELRLQIYSFCVPSGSITIAATNDNEPAVSAQGQEIAGLLPGKTPVLKPVFDRALLEANQPANEPQTETSDDRSNDAGGNSASWEGRKWEKASKRLLESASPVLSRVKRRHIWSGFTPHRSPDSSISSRIPSNSDEGLDGGCSKKDDSCCENEYQSSRTSSMALQEPPTERLQQYPYRYLPFEALHLVCRQIHNELLTYSKDNIKTPPHPRRLDLYLSFPDGVSIAVQRYKNLVRIARAVHVTGVWEFRGMADPRLLHPSSQPRLEGEEPVSRRQPGHDGTSDLQIDQINALEHLTHCVLGKNTTQAAERFQQEHYPGYVFPDPRASPPPESDIRDAAAREFAATFTPMLELRIFHPSAPQHHPYRAKPPAQTSDYKADTGACEALPSKRAQVAFSQAICMRSPDSQRATAPSLALPSTSSELTSMLIPHPSARPPPRPIPRHKPASASSSTSTSTSTPEDTYSLLWTHTLSPGPAALQCIYGGDIKMAVARHVSGNAIRLTGKCNFAKGRYLSMNWPKLEEDTRGEGVREWLVPRSWGGDGNLDEGVGSGTGKGDRFRSW